ncbi:hypothetical protein Tco_1281063 [Tanacetum coccineum]
MSSVKKSIAKRALHKREYDSRVNERQMQTHEGKVDMGKALDASLVVTESSGTESGKQDTSSRSGNDTDVDDANIRPSYDEEPMVEVQSTVEHNVSANAQQHVEQPEFNNEGGVGQDVKQCHDKRRLTLKSGKLGRFLNENSNQAKVKNDIDVTETINIKLEHSVKVHSVVDALTLNIT